MKNIEIITNKIHFIRSRKVMLNYDLALLYEIETRVLKQAVRRNIVRFPDDFMFSLNKDEFEILRFQFEAHQMSLLVFRKIYIEISIYPRSKNLTKDLAFRTSDLTI